LRMASTSAAGSAATVCPFADYVVAMKRLL
jgi:hypothetical protein